MITLDIESTPIIKGSPLFVTPTGIAIRNASGSSEYLAWGHPTDNSCTEAQALKYLKSIWGKEWVTHNGLGFDVPALERYFKLPKRDPLLTHDTLFMAYLYNPHAKSLSLKDLAADWLGMPPDEQQELYDWIMVNVPQCTARSRCGEFIAYAPGDLVGRYAVGDVDRTWGLFEYLKESVLGTMLEPYNRERRLAPILSEMQYRGVRIDIDRLEQDTETAKATLYATDAQIRKELNAPDLDVEKDAQLIDALKKQGVKGFLMTPTGKVSASKDSLDAALATLPELRALLKKRAIYATLVSTFMTPYVALGRANGGRLHPTYNQTRNPEGYGTRTGRLSCQTPNFQNQPKDLGEEYPNIRSYFLPEEGHVWVTGDFKNQEPRLAAHFENGALMEAFNANPMLDPYLYVADVCSVLRKEAKVILLGLLYSMGAASLAEKLDDTEARATMLRNIVRGALPDVMSLDRDCKRRFQAGLPIKTLGGRIYFKEPSGVRDLAYKALNTLIQGSAADQTKEAIIYTYEHLQEGEYILGTVHDEISVSSPEHRVADIERLLNEAANTLPVDVPFLMDVGFGANWSEAK